MLYLFSEPLNSIFYKCHLNGAVLLGKFLRQSTKTNQNFNWTKLSVSFVSIFPVNSDQITSFFSETFLEMAAPQDEVWNAD